jgi:hypothetical protein
MKVEMMYKIYVDRHGNDVYLYPKDTMNTQKHECAGCFYHENKIDCDAARNKLVDMPDCGVTAVYLEAPARAL